MYQDQVDNNNKEKLSGFSRIINLMKACTQRLQYSRTEIKEMMQQYMVLKQRHFMENRIVKYQFILTDDATS